MWPAPGGACGRPGWAFRPRRRRRGRPPRMTSDPASCPTPPRSRNERSLHRRKCGVGGREAVVGDEHLVELGVALPQLARLLEERLGRHGEELGLVGGG